jgi:hypothetical protein
MSSISRIASVGNIYPSTETSQTSGAQSTFAVFQELASALQEQSLGRAAGP